MHLGSLISKFMSKAGPPPGAPPAAVPNYTLATRDGVIAVQQRLSELGYLDPPADGGWGPVSKWALQAFCMRAGVPFALEAITPAMKDALANAKPLLLNPGSGLASRIVRAMLAKGYWLARHPDCVNIVYVEGTNPDGTRNDNRPNRFNDIRCVIRIDAAGVPVMAGGPWEATTEPGRFFTEHPMNPGGAFHIKPGEYKAWVLGEHHTHEAWVQAGEIEGYRDAENRMARDFRHPVRGSGFGVNQHWGYDLPRDELRNSSAGCLVGRSTDGHREFMRVTKGDARFRANPAYRVMTAVLGPHEVP